MTIANLLELEGSTGNLLAASEWIPESARHAERPCALFMHGGGQTRHSWQNAAREISGIGLRTLTVDARGHGDSEWVADGDYSFQRFRDDLRAVAQRLKDESSGYPPVVIGASMGGISAMMAQELRSEGGGPLFSAIVMVDITPRMERSGVDRIMGFMTQNVAEGFASVEEAADVIAAYLPNRPRPKDNSGLRKNLRQRENGRWYWHWDPAFVKGASNIETNADERREIMFNAVRKIDVPTLLVRGKQSELVSEEAVAEFLNMVPHAEFVDVSGAGHMVAGDRNDVFAGAVMWFLRRTVLETAPIAEK